MEHQENALRHDFTLALSPCLGEVEARQFHRPRLPLHDKYKIVITQGKKAMGKKGQSMRTLTEEKNIKLGASEGQYHHMMYEN